MIDFRKDHQDHCVFLPCDKNIGSCMMPCKCLYFQETLQIYSDKNSLSGGILRAVHTLCTTFVRNHIQAA